MISIHAPREGGDGRRDDADADPGDFNPRPPRGGRHALAEESAAVSQISIHAPREGGDCS